jgi:hypothetical protein
MDTMLGKLIQVLLVSGPLALFSAAASAAPITFSYDFTGPNVTADSLSFSQSGVGLTVSGYRYTAPETINANVQINRGTNGLGVCGTLLVGASGGCSSPLLDGGSASNVDNELLKFSFSAGVSLESIRFFNNDTNDVFDFFLGEPLGLQFAFLTPTNGQRVYTFADPIPAGLVFGVGVRGNSDQVRIEGLTVRYDAAVVPLPAGGLLLIGAFATLAALRRRRGASGAMAH